MAATSVKKVENKTARRGFLKWAKSRKGQQTLIILAFTIIPLVLLAAFTYVPFAEMVKFSFYKMKYSTPVDKRVFVGWKNYIEVFRNKDIFASLWLSLYYMVGSVVQLALALFLATILSFKTRGGNLFKGLMFFPYLISGIAIGFIFKYFYTRGFVFDSILGWFGFELDSLPYWLRDQKINNWSLVATSVWRYFGNNMVLFIGAIMSVDSEMYEAAELDGAVYYFDPTWDLQDDESEVALPGYLSHTWFALTAERMAVRHTADDPTIWPDSRANADNYYVRSGYTAAEATVAAAAAAVRSQWDDGRAVLEFRCETPEVYAGMQSLLFERDRLWDVYRALGSYVSSSGYQCADDQQIIRLIPAR